MIVAGEGARLVARRLAVPRSVVEVGVFVCDLVAVQPVDGHTGGDRNTVLGVGGVGVVPGVDLLGRTHDAKLGRMREQRGLRHPDEASLVLHERVVDGDVPRCRIARPDGHEEQPELRVGTNALGHQERVVRHEDRFLRGVWILSGDGARQQGAAEHQQQTGQRARQPESGRPRVQASVGALGGIGFGAGDVLREHEFKPVPVGDS